MAAAEVADADGVVKSGEVAIGAAATGEGFEAENAAGSGGRPSIVLLNNYFHLHCSYIVTGKRKSAPALSPSNTLLNGFTA